MLYSTSKLRFRAICPDGKVRTARPSAEADTFFSIPASVKAHGRTISGFVTASDSVHNGDAGFAAMLGDAEQDAFRVQAEYIFYPRRDSANGPLLGTWDVPCDHGATDAGECSMIRERLAAATDAAIPLCARHGAYLGR